MMRYLYLIVFIVFQLGVSAQIDGTSGITVHDTKARLDAVAPVDGGALFGFVSSTNIIYKWDGDSWELVDNLGVSDIVSVVRNRNDLIINYEVEGIANIKTLSNAFVGDNLGDHTATENIQLNGEWLSGDGGDEGVFVGDDGGTGIGTTLIQSKLNVNGTIKAGGTPFNVGTGVTNEALVTMDAIRAAGGFNLRTPSVGDAIFTGFKFVGNKLQMLVNNSQIATFAANGTSSVPNLLSLNRTYNPFNSAASINNISCNYVNFHGNSSLATYSALSIGPVINQTGDNVSPTRGIRILPNLINVVDWKSIELNANDGYNIYADGTAENYFAGNVGIGQPNPSQKLDVSGKIKSNPSPVTVSRVYGDIGDGVMGFQNKNDFLSEINTEIVVNQEAHDFEVGQPIFNKNGVWGKSHTANYEALSTISFVSEVIDVDNFVISQKDVIYKEAHGLPIGEKHFLTETGEISTDKAHSIVCEVFTPIDDNHLQISRTQPHSRNGLFNDLTTRYNAELSVHEATTVTLRIKTFNGFGYSINWGDDAQTAASSDEVHSHTYSQPFSGFISIKGLDGLLIEEIETTGPFTVSIENIANYAPLVEIIDLKSGGKYYGDAQYIPNSVVFFNADKGFFFGKINPKGKEHIRCVIDCKIELPWNELDEETGYIGLTGGINGTKVYGDIAAVQFTNPTHIDVQGQSTLGGDLGFLGNFPVFLNLSGKCEINSYTAKSQGGTMNFINRDARTFIIAGNSVLSNGNIDDILKDLDDETDTWGNSGNIILTAGGSRTSDSDAAVASLKSKGATITINGILQ